MQDCRKAVWSIPYVSVASFFPSLKHNFIAYRSSKVSSRPDCIFEIPQLWQSGFSRVYSNCCCSCSFEAEIIKIGLLSCTMYSNTILNFQESITILNACTKKKSGNLLKAPLMFFKLYIIFYLWYFWWCSLYSEYANDDVQILFYIAFWSGGAPGVGNEFSEPSSNPGRVSLSFTSL